MTAMGLCTKELMLSNCGAEDSWESLELQREQNFLKEINPEYSLEVLMLQLKLQYFWLSDVKNQLIGKDSDAAKIAGKKRRGWQRMR